MLLDGKKVAADIRMDVSTAAQELRTAGVDPILAVVVATDDDATGWYVSSLVKSGEKSGLTVQVHDLGATAVESEITDVLDRLGRDVAVHGIILQTPLPDGVSLDTLTSLIPPAKDVDGANPLSAGRLLAGQSAFAPATAAAVLILLAAYEIELEGSHAVVLGRSLVVGKPVAHLLLARNATVTVCHSHTKDLAGLTKTADVLVVAVGKPGLIGKAHIKPGATVIDVGTTQGPTGRLVGDVETLAVEEIAGAVSPVPGGVGPVTTALLIRNTITAAQVATNSSSQT